MTLITRHVLSRSTTTTACRTKSYKCGVHGDGRQASHWKDNLSLGIMDPTTAPGEQLTITALDLTPFDVIGWNLTSTPAPASALVFAFGLAGLGLARRRTLA